MSLLIVVKKCDLVDNVTIDLWYVVCVVHGRRPPNFVFEGIIFGPFYTLRELITYVSTKYRENNLMEGRDIYPQNEI